MKATHVLALVLLCVGVPALAQDEPTEQPTDLLTFAAGAIPLEVRGPGVELGAGFEEAIEATDGSPQSGTIYRRQASPDTWVEFVYALPAATTFTSFGVPNIGETPSPSQTFTRRVEVYGGTDPTSELTLLAAADLAPHAERGEVTTFAPEAATPVTVVAIRLIGGVEEGATFFEFSELIAHGTQDPIATVDHFDGLWDPNGGLLELHQDGVTVTGCADNGRKSLAGTVVGNLLYATLKDNTSGVQGAFIAGIDATGAIRGVRSDNGAPFRLYTGAAAADGTPPPCSTPEAPTLGCGDVIHGIRFGFDSAEILAESAPVLDALYEGLSGDGRSVTIEGHTSSEGSDAYNQELSERRAASVVEALTARGIESSRLSAVGRGESDPMAREDTEAGRALNRRVEVHCVD